MNNQIVLALKRKLGELAASGGMDGETVRNALKEDLQYYILNFIYHHEQYSKWIMYGGSALRICHNLDRMSVDLDFEVGSAISDTLLEQLKNDLERHFCNTYGVPDQLLSVKITSGRGVTLRFAIGKELGLELPSEKVHVKIDLNHFEAPKAIVERVPVNRDQLSFVIRSYNLATLMASKIAAIFLRPQRGVGEAYFNEKGRDIYDLLWYMSKKVAPDFGYLAAKGISPRDLRDLFDTLTIRMNDVSDENLKQDLMPLFANRAYIEDWLQNWRESFLRRVDEYDIHTVTAPRSIHVQQEFHSDIFYFGFIYETAVGESVRFVFALSDYWITFGNADLKLNVDPKVVDQVQFARDFSSSREVPKGLLGQYAYLFFTKVEQYLDRVNRVIVGKELRTKVIRMTADKLNQKEQILLNMSALKSCQLEDLLL